MAGSCHGRSQPVMLGQVMVDGHGIKGLKLKWLRQQIGLVSQEPTFFAIIIQEKSF
ncbi:putative Type 1 protein exporter [Helianthus debilis subsp. tardiflorus]